MVAKSPSTRRVGWSDAAALGRTAAVVRRGRHVLDGADLEADGTQRTDRGLPAGAGALDEHVDLLHAVLHRTPAGRLGGHLRGERGGLARPLEADGPGAGPRDHRAGGVGDRHDRVVERALDVGLAHGDVLLLLAAHLLGACGLAAPGWHLAVLLKVWGCSSRLGGPRSPGVHGGLAPVPRLLAGLLLAGHRALGPLARARVGPGALATDREALAVAAALVAADLDLAADVGGHFAAEVTLDLEVGLDVVAELDQLVVAQLVHPQVGADAGGVEQLVGAGTADAEDVRAGALQALV